MYFISSFRLAIPLLGMVILFSAANVYGAHGPKKKDPETDMIIAKNWELVKGVCTKCHSSKLVIQNRGTKDVWLERIRWMQKTQGLWDLGALETPILDYLSQNYPPPGKEMEAHPVDEDSGLIMEEGWQIVKGVCTKCHSSRLIIQNRGTRDVWVERIRWMQKTQGLWDLGALETPILDYLESNYAPPARRPGVGGINPLAPR